jgi:hypothetical protein
MLIAFAGVASAAVTKVTGGSTQLVVSDTALALLTNNHTTPSALAPASLSGATLTFPISGGRLNTASLRGIVNHRGGLELTNGTATVSLRRPTIVSNRAGVSLYALVRGRVVRRCQRIGGHVHRHLVCDTTVRYHTARIARVTALSVSNGTATGTINITQFTASVINRLAGKSVITAGTAIGTATITPTLA